MSYKITEECIGCTLCKRNCPAGAISGNTKELHIIDEDYCIDCGLCGKLCPKGAILDQSGKKTVKTPKDQWAKPVVNDDCVGCSLCVENCPMDCLKISEPKFHGDINTVAFLFDSSRCIGCKICKSVCPIDAISF